MDGTGGAADTDKEYAPARSRRAVALCIDEPEPPSADVVQHKMADADMKDPRPTRAALVRGHARDQQDTLTGAEVHRPPARPPARPLLLLLRMPSRTARRAGSTAAQYYICTRVLLRARAVGGSRSQPRRRP